jgi:hypothetical protein
MALIDAEPPDQPALKITQEVPTAELIASYLDPTREAAHDTTGTYTTPRDVTGGSR